MVFVVLEVNVSARQDTSPAWLSAANFLVLCLYFVETILKLFALLSEFFFDPLSVLDVFVITVDCGDDHRSAHARLARAFGLGEGGARFEGYEGVANVGDIS